MPVRSSAVPMRPNGTSITRQAALSPGRVFWARIARSDTIQMFAVTTARGDALTLNAVLESGQALRTE